MACKGKVTAKHERDGETLVDLDVWADNERGRRDDAGDSDGEPAAQTVAGLARGRVVLTVSR
jgi:hypothetical protein